MIHPPYESPLANRVVIVLGSMRSGTTWLVELLMSHPELGGVQSESVVFDGLWDFWVNGHRVDGEGISAHLPVDQLTASMRRFCDRAFTAALRHHAPGASWFVEKTPDHINYLPLIAATHPDAWYVHIVRDGRDVSRSMAKAPFGPKGVAAAAASWTWKVRYVQQQRWRLPRFKEVRYEDLTRDPVGSVSALLDWLGLPPDGEVVDGIRDRAGRPISAAPGEEVGPGKWRDLSEEDLELIYTIAGDLLSELGYLDEAT